MAFRPKNSEERIKHRLKIAQGHLKKVAEMVDSGAYCIDVITQSQAVQQSLKEIDAIILENHLQTCVVESIQTGNAEHAIAEVLQVFRKRAT